MFRQTIDALPLFSIYEIYIFSTISTLADVRTYVSKCLRGKHPIISRSQRNLVLLEQRISSERSRRATAPLETASGDNLDMNEQTIKMQLAAGKDHEHFIKYNQVHLADETHDGRIYGNALSRDSCYTGSRNIYRHPQRMGESVPFHRIYASMLRSRAIEVGNVQGVKGFIIQLAHDCLEVRFVAALPNIHDN